MRQIQAEAGRKAELERELEQLDRLTRLARLDETQLARALQREAADVAALLWRETSPARAAAASAWHSGAMPRASRAFASTAASSTAAWSPEGRRA